MPKFSGNVDVVNSASTLTIRLDGEAADISAGGGGQDGDLVLKDTAGNERLRIDGQTGTISIRNITGSEIVRIDGGTGDVTIGGAAGIDGDIVLKDGAGENRIRLDAAEGSMSLGGNGADGDLFIYRSSGNNSFRPRATIHIDGDGANIWAGGSGTDGDLMLFPKSATNINALAQATVNVDGEGSAISLRAGGQRRLFIDGAGGNIWAGGNGVDGDLVLFRGSGDNQTLPQACIHLDAELGNIRAGGNGTHGDLSLFPLSATNITDAGQASISLTGGNGHIILRSMLLDGKNGDIYAGGKGVDGELMLFPSSATSYDKSEASLRLDGDAGDIILRNADCAEDFDVAEDACIEPGTVVMVDEDGMVRPTQAPYEKRVVGVVSGAGDRRPGIILDRTKSKSERQTVALMGKVYCWADAKTSPIEAGDLITTSATSGHAMKAEQRPEAFGAVIGKALGSLADGRGLVPVLVALQ